ncbi:hypothetical protein CR513_52857, partial [Mucuna pruriens]
MIQLQGKRQRSLERKEIRLDFEVVMLMVTTSTKSSNDTSWYLDFGCSIHMTGKREWFISLEDSSKRKVRFVDDCSLNEEGIRRVSFRVKDERETGMKTNL